MIRFPANTKIDTFFIFKHTIRVNNNLVKGVRRGIDMIDAMHNKNMESEGKEIKDTHEYMKIEGQNLCNKKGSPLFPELILVKSVAEYLDAVDFIFTTLCNDNQGSNCQLWYRGHVQESFDLLPTITREKGGLQLNPLFETAFLSKFKSAAIAYVEKLPKFPLNDDVNAYWNWLFILRHYGLPARILDWSRDALTGLFFATNPEDPCLTPGVNAAVWLLNPVRLNESFSFHSFLKPGYIPSVEEPSFNLFFGPESDILNTLKPAAAIGPLNTTRIVAQRGTFTVFPRVKTLLALNKFEDSDKYLTKIMIDCNSIDKIQTQLRHYGITRLALYPDMESIASEVFQEVIDEGINTTEIK